jgi:ankyrin repeat protein
MELEEAEAKLSAESPSPVEILEFVLDDDRDGFVTKLGGNSSLLNQPMWFDLPMPDMLEDGPTLPMVMSVFGSARLLRHCVELGFDASIADSFGRSVEHFAAAGGSMDIFTLLLDTIPGLRVDLLGRAGRLPVDYAALMDRADLLEVLLTRGSPVALPETVRTRWFFRRWHA